MRATLCQAENVGDRVVLRLGPTAFTQRQLERHIPIRSILSQAKEIEIVHANNYRDCLEVFRKDMIILLEILRIERAAATKLRLDQALNQIEAARQSSPSFANLLLRLGVNEASLKAQVASALQILDYRSVKEKSRQKNWFFELQERHDQGLFQNANSFVDIHPNG